jgi:hypothetical protein
MRFSRMQAGGVIMLSTVAAGVGAYESGYQEEVCTPIVESLDFIDSPDTKTKITFNMCELAVRGTLMTESVGTGRLTVRNDLGKIALIVNPIVGQTGNTVGIPGFKDKAIAFGSGEIIKKLKTEKLSINWQKAEEDGIVLASHLENGVDMGIDMSAISFTELEPEYDMMDGVDDEACPTKFDSVDYPGCWFDTYFDNGWSEWADLREEIIPRFDTIRSLKVMDNSCLMMHAIPSAVETVLRDEFNIQLTRDEEGADLIARLLVAGMIKEQLAESFGNDFPIQLVMVKIDPAKKFDVGTTYPEMLEKAPDLGNLTDADGTEDWCMVFEDTNGKGFVVAQKQLIRLIHSAFALPGWNFRSGQYEPGNARLRQPANIEKYQELGYA